MVDAMRTATIKRKTTETNVTASINLDGNGRYDIKTGIGFFSHMLEQLARHSFIDITLQTKGDLHIDAHHSIEDTGIVLGQCLAAALGDKIGIKRYGSALLVMDDALIRAALDLSGRPYLIWKVAIPTEKIATLDSEVFREFFTALTVHAGLNLHVQSLDGINSHHIIEATFKAIAQALRRAIKIDPSHATAILSTKGTLKK